MKITDPGFVWIKAADHLTDQGRADFAARQRKRMEEAQKKTEANPIVRTITQKRKAQ